MVASIWAAPFLGPADAVAVPVAQTHEFKKRAVAAVGPFKTPLGRTTGSMPVEIGPSSAAPKANLRESMVLC